MKPRDMSASGLERYIVGEHLGQGATSDVFKVTDVLTRKEYVLKQMSLESMTHREKLRVKKEIDVMNDVDHPNIVKFRESFSGDRSVNIIMERCVRTLEELIEQQQQQQGGRPFQEEIIIEWMAELLCGLAHLHSRRILHRDIKTSNIFLTDKNHVKLGDFGVCTVLTSPTMTAHSMIGTPLYFSPEVCEEGAYDERSDVWSLGVVFYEMCTLRRPFDANHLPGIIQQILTKDVAPFNTGLDARFEEIVRSMLRKCPHDRPTAQDLIDNHLIVPPSHPSHPTQKPSRSRLIQQYYGPELVFGGGPTAVSLDGERMNDKKESKTEGCKDDDDDDDDDNNNNNGGWGNGEQGRQEEQQEQKSRQRQKQHGRVHVIAAAPCDARRKGEGMGGGKTDIVGKNKNMMGLEDRVEALKRIKGARSKINMAELRQNMLRKRSELFGGLDAPAVGDVPIIIELQQDLRAQQEVEFDHQTHLFAESVRSSSSFLEDIAAVIELHSIGGAKIDLEQLDDAASLLCQYKLTNHGLY